MGMLYMKFDFWLKYKKLKQRSLFCENNLTHERVNVNTHDWSVIWIYGEMLISLV